MWNNEKQQRNALEIARQAGALYDKFEGLLKDLINIGKKIDATKTDYSAAMNKLVEGRGNLITSVEKLKKMEPKQKRHYLKRSFNVQTKKNKLKIPQLPSPISIGLFLCKYHKTSHLLHPPLCSCSFPILL